jgi:hypothetical protein
VTALAKLIGDCATRSVVDIRMSVSRRQICNQLQNRRWHG